MAEKQKKLQEVDYLEKARELADGQYVCGLFQADRPV